MTDCVAGIDPGLDGAVAVLYGDGDLSLHRTPVIAAGKSGKRKLDLAAMRELLVFAKPSLVVLELVHAMPKQGVTSVFSFGHGFGAWEGLLVGLGIPYQLVPPQAWQKAVLAGSAKDKQAAIAFASRRFPGVSFLASPRSRVPHDGICDATCLAVYARRLLNGKGD